MFNVKMLKIFSSLKKFNKRNCWQLGIHCKCLGYENHSYTKYYNKILAVTEEENWVTNKVSGCTQGQEQPWEGQTLVVPSYSPL